MKTLEEILRGKSPYGLVTIEDWQVEAMQEYANEYAKEALRLASESAKFIAEHQFYEETIKDSVDNVGSYLVFIDKQSILSENNLPSHS